MSEEPIQLDGISIHFSGVVGRDIYCDIVSEAHSPAGTGAGHKSLILRSNLRVESLLRNIPPAQLAQCCP
jgi:hypothetical protein